MNQPKNKGLRFENLLYCQGTGEKMFYSIDTWLVISSLYLVGEFTLPKNMFKQAALSSSLSA